MTEEEVISGLAAMMAPVGHGQDLVYCKAAAALWEEAGAMDMEDLLSDLVVRWLEMWWQEEEDG